MYFICPNCKQRSVDHDGLQELDDVPVACESCGFGFLFELNFLFFKTRSLQYQLIY